MRPARGTRVRIPYLLPNRRLSTLGVQLFRKQIDRFAVAVRFCSLLPGYIEYAGIAQLVEHNVANVEVVGSNPISRSNIIAPLVQWREYGATNAETGVRFSRGVPKSLWKRG